MYEVEIHALLQASIAMLLDTNFILQQSLKVHQAKSILARLLRTAVSISLLYMYSADTSICYVDVVYAITYCLTAAALAPWPAS